MKTNNILNKIKEELRSNAIQPSENAWDTMSAMLDAQEEKKSKKKIAIWAYVAAFAGLLIGLTVLFQDNSAQNGLDDVVIEEPTVNSDSIYNKNTQNTVEKEVIVVNEVPASKLKKETPKPVKQKQLKQFKTVNKTQISYVQSTSGQEGKQKDVVASTKDLALASTIVKKEKKPLMQSSDSDIDALLIAALGNKEHKTYALEVAENALQKTAATKGDMTVNKFLKNAIQTGVDTVEDIITANDN